MARKLATYDPAEDLTSDAATAAFMAEAFDTEGPGCIAHARKVATRAKDMKPSRYARKCSTSCRA
jgi:DNA-binding phage protein